MKQVKLFTHEISTEGGATALESEINLFLADHPKGNCEVGLLQNASLTTGASGLYLTAAIAYECDESEIILARSVETLELSIRCQKALKKYNIKTIGQLVEKSEAQLLKTQNFGKKSMQEIKDALARLNLRPPL